MKIQHFCFVLANAPQFRVESVKDCGNGPMIKRATGRRSFCLSQEEETESGLGRIFFANDRPAQRLTLAVNQLMDDPGAPL